MIEELGWGDVYIFWMGGVGHGVALRILFFVFYGFCSIVDFYYLFAVQMFVFPIQLFADP